MLPFQRGFLLNMELQQQIWEHLFSRDAVNVDDASDTQLIITEPWHNFQSIQQAMDEMLFETFDFRSLFRTKAFSAAFLSCYNYLHNAAAPTRLDRCCIVVDCGYSFTHIVPFNNGVPIIDAVLRIEVGGKLLTNQLKEVLSYRQLQIMEETYVINQCKEDACFVSLDFAGDMATCKRKSQENPIVRDYVLPDFVSFQRGFLINPNNPLHTNVMYENSQLLRLNHERFAIPEILFRPSDIGIDQMGVAEALVHTVLTNCPPDLHPELFANIVLTGGSCRFDGFAKRLEAEVLSLANDTCRVKVVEPGVGDGSTFDASDYAWAGGSALAGSASAGRQCFVSKEEYREYGHGICSSRFDSNTCH